MNLSVAIVGSGGEEGSLRTLAEKLQAKVTFLGERKQSELPLLINQSRIFLLNSSYEGSPHALLEAMACGAICVARASTGTSEVIRDGVNGFLCDDVRNLESTLSLVLAGNIDIKEVSSRARAYAVDYCDVDKNYSSITDLLKKLK